MGAKGKEKFDDRVLGDSGEGGKVSVRGLVVAVCDESSLVPFNVVVFVGFDLIDEVRWKYEMFVTNW